MKKVLRKIDYFATKHRIYLYLSIIFAVSIFIGSVTPEKEIAGIMNSGAFAHLLSYFILSSTILLHLSRTKIEKPFLKAILLAGNYGILMEFVQAFIVYRKFEVFDIAINFIGASLIFIFLFIKRIPQF